MESQRNGKSTAQMFQYFIEQSTGDTFSHKLFISLHINEVNVFSIRIP